MPDSPTASHATFIERFGIVADRAGLSRIAGRIMGLLFFSPSELSLDEIAERLSVSRASVSTEARRLLDAGVVERVGRPGDRKDYYQVSPRHYLHDLEHQFESMQEFVRLLDEGGRGSSNEIVRARLAKAVQAYSGIMGIISRTITQWKAEMGPPETISGSVEASVHDAATQHRTHE